MQERIRANTDSSPAPAKSQKAAGRPGMCSGALSIRARTCSSEIIESPSFVEPLGAMLDPKDIVFEVLSIGFDCGELNVRTQERGNAKDSPEMRFCGADLVEN